MNNFIFSWLIVALFFLLFELGSPGLFYLLSFACGALITSFVGIFYIPPFDQAVMLFLGSSIGALFILRKWVKRHGRQKHYHSNVYALQGKKGVVISPATVDQFGHVHIDGEIWAYKAKDNTHIPAGITVEVIDMRGAHVVVKQINNS